MLVLRRVLFKHHLPKTGLVLQPEKKNNRWSSSHPPLLPGHYSASRTPEESTPITKIHECPLTIQIPTSNKAVYIWSHIWYLHNHHETTYEKGTFEIPIGNHFRGSGFCVWAFFFRINLPTLTTNIIKNYIYVRKGIYLHGLHLALLFLKWDYPPWN